MKFFVKMERKFAKYAIPNLMNYIIAMYAVGVLINMWNPMFFYTYLDLDVSMILKGQVWRLITFLMQPPSSGLIWNLLALYLYYMLGSTLERTWGTFRFNVYFFMGVLGHILAAFVIYFVFHLVYPLSTGFLNMSLFFAFAATYPNLQFLLFFIIPVKAKWLALFDGILYAYMFIIGGALIRVEIVLSLANFIVFFLMTRNLSHINPKQVKRRHDFQKQVKMTAQGTRHKCAVCGRTEKDDENLEFRYCSKCEGSYEYCMEHLYTHKHVGGDSNITH